MQRLVLIFPVAVAVVAIWALATGQDAAVARWAAGMQRDVQNGLAQGLRAIRAGNPGALAALMGLCFAYGFFHAVGPGHGKILIGGYGLARKVPILRLSVISLLSSMGQALSAIVLVFLGIYALGWSRARLTDTAETVMLPISAAAIALIGLWLAFRGLRRALRFRATDHRSGETTCCNHRHGPTVEEVRQTAGPGESLALIGSIAIRPCSGAILLLVLTWHMNILPAGILGTLAMSAGTAALTICVAVLSVTARESTLLSLGGSRAATVALPVVELLAGAAIMLVGIRMIG